MRKAKEMSREVPAQLLHDSNQEAPRYDHDCSLLTKSSCELRAAPGRARPARLQKAHSVAIPLTASELSRLAIAVENSSFDACSL